MRLTIRRVAGLVAVVAGPLIACNPGKSTMPGFEPAAAGHSNAEIVAPVGDTLRTCPEMRIPELPCLSGDPRQP